MKAKLKAIWILATLVSGSLSDHEAHATDRVDLALALIADVSGSVDDHRFRLQREGYAAALTSENVLRAIASGPTGTIAITLIEFASSNNQRTVVDWTVLRDAESASIFADLVRAEPRSFQGGTAIGAAIDFAVAQFDISGIEAARRTIDVSGDGTNNDGRPVVDARDEAVAAGITINGIAILSPENLDSHTNPPGGLLDYYRQHVIGGPGAFALAAEDFSAFAYAVQNKLIREIADDSVARSLAQALPPEAGADLLP